MAVQSVSGVSSSPDLRLLSLDLCYSRTVKDKYNIHAITMKTKFCKCFPQMTKCIAESFQIEFVDPSVKLSCKRHEVNNSHSSLAFQIQIVNLVVYFYQLSADIFLQLQKEDEVTIVTFSNCNLQSWLHQQFTQRSWLPPYDRLPSLPH